MDFFNDIFHNLALLEFYFLNIILHFTLHRLYIVNIFPTFKHFNPSFSPLMPRIKYRTCWQERKLRYETGDIMKGNGNDMRPGSSISLPASSIDENNIILHWTCHWTESSKIPSLQWNSCLCNLWSYSHILVCLHLFPILVKQIFECLMACHLMKITVFFSR